MASNNIQGMREQIIGISFHFRNPKTRVLTKCSSANAPIVYENLINNTEGAYIMARPGEKFDVVTRKRIRADELVDVHIAYRAVLITNQMDRQILTTPDCETMEYALSYLLDHVSEIVDDCVRQRFKD